ncbi:membrane protein [Streptomyces chiangmaiensis]
MPTLVPAESAQCESTLPAEPVALHERSRRLVRRYGPAVACYAALKLVGFYIFMRLVHYSGYHLTKPLRLGGGAHPWDVLASFDGWWYQQVAEFGYDPQLVPVTDSPWYTFQENSAAFFPLYPGLMRLVSEFTGLGLYGAGMMVSVVASLFAAAGIFAVAERLGGVRAGVIAAGLWAVCPGSGAEWAVYSDSTFVALTAWSCYAVLTGRWITAGLLTLVAGLNRPTSATLIAAVGLAGLVALYRRTDGIGRPLAAMTLAPLGLLGYVGWVGWRMGDWGGYFKLQRGAWLHFFDGGRFTVATMRSVLLGRSDYLFASPVPDLLAGLIIMALPVLILLLVRLRPPAVLMVHTLVTIATVLGSQQVFSNISRYLLPAFPLLIPPAIALSRLNRLALAACLGTCALASGWFAGFAIFQLGAP